jgi:MGT family glycosyltransferase
MTRLLVATAPLIGHVRPMRVLVEELTARGHEVIWYTGRAFEPSIAAAGARFLPMRAARDWDGAAIEAALHALRHHHGLTRVKAQLNAMFIAPMLEQLRDLEDALHALAPDVVVSDSAHLGAALLADKHAVPWVTLGISPLVIPSEDTAPFGSALPPAVTCLGRARNRLLNWAVQRVLFADVNRNYRRGRLAAGLPAGSSTYFDVLSPQLHLQPTVPAFEYPRRDLPRQVHFIGPLLPRPPSLDAVELPAWWPEVADAHARSVPIVLVHQGTLATDGSELVVPTLHALAGEPVLVVATTPANLAALGLSELPPNARVASFIPHEALLPRVSVMVTNGGYHGTQLALAHGVPLVVAGGSEDKPEVAARVAWSGAGVDLRRADPSARAVRQAVRRVLSQARFAVRARELAEQATSYDARVRGAELIEGLMRMGGAPPASCICQRHLREPHRCVGTQGG